MSKITYDSALVIGMGLIGSSIAKIFFDNCFSLSALAMDDPINPIPMTSAES